MPGPPGPIPTADPGAPESVRRVAEEPAHAAEALFATFVTECSATHLEAACRLPAVPVGQEHPVGRLGPLADMTAGRAVRARLPLGRSVRTADLRLDLTGRGLGGDQ